MIGRAEKNGPQGDGLNQEVCFTLNTVDEHAVATRSPSKTILNTSYPRRAVQSRQTAALPAAVVKHWLPIISPITLSAALCLLECSRLQRIPGRLGRNRTPPGGYAARHRRFLARGIPHSLHNQRGVVPKNQYLPATKPLPSGTTNCTPMAQNTKCGQRYGATNALFFVSRAVAQISADEHRPADTVKPWAACSTAAAQCPCRRYVRRSSLYGQAKSSRTPSPLPKTHLPNVRHLGNVSAIDGGKIEPVDIFTFGSPCQDLSIAGRRKGLKGQKSSLFWEAIRIASEMLAATGGRYRALSFGKNVYGALSSNGGDDFEIVLNELLHLTGSNEFIQQHGIWGGFAGMEKLPTVLSMRNIGECPASQTCLCCR